MASLKNYSVSQQGQTVRVFGDVVDDTTGATIATFGQSGISFVTWFQALALYAQIEFIRDVASPYMVQNLLGTWPGPNPAGQSAQGGQG